MLLGCESLQVQNGILTPAVFFGQFFRMILFCLFASVFYTQFEREICQNDLGFRKSPSKAGWHSSMVSETCISTDFGLKGKSV